MILLDNNKRKDESMSESIGFSEQTNDKQKGRKGGEASNKKKKGEQMDPRSSGYFSSDDLDNLD